jgi:excisionase family DNA binding protein
MTVNERVAGALHDALDALELAELSILAALGAIDEETGMTDTLLLTSLENIALARARVDYRHSAVERKLAAEIAEQQAERQAERQAAIENKPASREDVVAAMTNITATVPKVVAGKSGERPRDYTPRGERYTMPDDMKVGEARLIRPEPIEPTPDLTIAELCRELKVSDSHIYRLIQDGKIKVRRDGRKRGTLIPGSEVDLLRSIAATKPPERKTLAGWLTRSLERAGR